jgi:hypothetical protein
MLHLGGFDRPPRLSCAVYNRASGVRIPELKIWRRLQSELTRWDFLNSYVFLLQMQLGSRTWYFPDGLKIVD